MREEETVWWLSIKCQLVPRITLLWKIGKAGVRLTSALESA